MIFKPDGRAPSLRSRPHHLPKIEKYPALSSCLGNEERTERRLRGQAKSSGPRGVISKIWGGDGGVSRRVNMGGMRVVLGATCEESLGPPEAGFVLVAVPVHQVRNTLYFNCSHVRRWWFRICITLLKKLVELLLAYPLLVPGHAGSFDNC
ncbi:hypothetical protein HAX54_011213 [Datura stramonium]|uniref:Uncharacterized protein n=1 Tax=Datura stramonium TaxID=4076 RepID=A0ABS8THH1_DATST|nr:hypothetical protein [Datura stramonium]